MFPQPLPFNALNFKDFMDIDNIKDASGVPYLDILKSIYYRVTPNDDEETPHKIYLYKQEASDKPVINTFNIDSYYGITNTLVVTWGGLALQTVLNERSNVKAKVHGHIQILHDNADDPLEL